MRTIAQVGRPVEDGLGWILVVAIGARSSMMVRPSGRRMWLRKLVIRLRTRGRTGTVVPVYIGRTSPRCTHDFRRRGHRGAPLAMVRLAEGRPVLASLPRNPRTQDASPHARRQPAHHRRQDLDRPRRDPGSGGARRPRRRPAPRPRGHLAAGVHRAPRSVASAFASRPRRSRPRTTRSRRRRAACRCSTSRRRPRSASWSGTARTSASRSTASARRARASSTSSARSWASPSRA